MEDLFRHVAGPLRRLWDAIQDADDRSWEAHRRQVHNELKEEEAKPPGTRDELLHEELTERSLELDMEDLQVGMEAVRPLLCRASCCAAHRSSALTRPNFSPPVARPAPPHAEAESLA